MKTRNGFVSNLSSSSFIIAYKDKADVRKKLEDIFKLPKGHILESFTERIAESIIHLIDEDKEFKDIKEYNKYIETGGYEDGELQELLEKGYSVASGDFVSDSENALEVYLCDTDLNYEDKDFIFKHEGGF
jgi:methionine salvage enolase-phosphatase E1